jgi:hypothetical protein
VAFEIGEDSGKGRAAHESFEGPTRDAIIPAPDDAEAASDAVTRVVPLDVIRAAAPTEPTPFPELPEVLPEVFAEKPAEPPPLASVPEPPAVGEKPNGKALADLYYAQGHYAEALQIYDDLVSRHPFDDDLKRLRRDAEARLLPAGSSPSGAAPDPAVEVRQARIRVLKRWLGQVQQAR